MTLSEAAVNGLCNTAFKRHDHVQASVKSGIGISSRTLRFRPTSLLSHLNVNAEKTIFYSQKAQKAQKMPIICAIWFGLFFGGPPLGTLVRGVDWTKLYQSGYEMGQSSALPNII